LHINIISAVLSFDIYFLNCLQFKNLHKINKYLKELSKFDLRFINTLHSASQIMTNWYTDNTIVDKTMIINAFREKYENQLNKHETQKFINIINYLPLCIIFDETPAKTCIQIANGSDILDVNKLGKTQSKKDTLMHFIIRSIGNNMNDSGRVSVSSNKIIIFIKKLIEEGFNTYVYNKDNITPLELAEDILKQNINNTDSINKITSINLLKTIINILKSKIEKDKRIVAILGKRAVEEYADKDIPIHKRIRKYLGGKKNKTKKSKKLIN